MATTAGLAGVRDQQDGAANNDLDFQPIVDRARGKFLAGHLASHEARDRLLARMHDMVMENSEDMVKAVKADLGRSYPEALLGEIGLLADEIKLTRANLKKWMAPQAASHPLQLKPGKSYVLPQGKGVVLIIGPWNFPIQLLLVPLVSAIAAGNCAVLKPSEVAPNCAKLVETLVKKYLDPDCFVVVNGGVPETTALLRAKWDHILYTGNGAVAKIVLRAAAEHLTPVTLELGGKSPVYVDKDADMDVAVRRILIGRYFNCGQICVSPDYVLCHKAKKQELLDKMQATVGKMYGANPKESESYGRIINERHWERVMGLLKTTTGKVVTGGEAGADKQAKYIPPTIVDSPAGDDRLMREEIFGPVLPVLGVDNADEAVAFINARERPLASYVFSQNHANAEAFVKRVVSGGSCINDCIMHITNLAMPFGGVGESGMGAYHGKAGFDEFSHRQAVMVRGTWPDIPQRYPPYKMSDVPFLKRIVFGPLLPPAVKHALMAGVGVAVAAVAFNVMKMFSLL